MAYFCTATINAREKDTDFCLPADLMVTVGRNASVSTALMERSDLQYQERRSGDGMEANVILLHPGLALAQLGEGGRMMNGRMMFVTQRVNEV